MPIGNAQADAVETARRVLYANPKTRDLALNALLEAAQVLLRKLGDQPNELKVEAIVSRSTGQARVDITWLGTFTQLDTEEVRRTTGILNDAADLAELEADMIAALKMREVEPGIASAILNDVRLVRESRKGGGH